MTPDQGLEKSGQSRDNIGMMTTNHALQGRVTGIVQGVCFRAETCKTARRLGLTGWVRNSADGAVELLIAGDNAALERMQLWLQHGPEQAVVDRVALAPCDDPGLGGFDIRY